MDPKTRIPGCFGGALTHDVDADDCKACRCYVACDREARKRRKELKVLGPVKPSSLLRNLRQSKRRRETLKQRARRIVEEVKALKVIRRTEFLTDTDAPSSSIGEDGE